MAGVAESEGLVAGAVVRHDARGLDAEALVVGVRGVKEGDGAFLFLVRHDPGEGDAGSVVDADMNVLPPQSLAARAPVALPSALSSDAMADAVDPAEFLDVDMDELARMLALVAAHRLGGLESGQAIEAEALENAADGGGGHTNLEGDLLAGQPLAAQGFDLLDNHRRRRPPQAARPRRPVFQAREASARKRPSHFLTVRGQTPAARAAASGVCPLSTRRTTRSRPTGVKRAFL